MDLRKLKKKARESRKAAQSTAPAIQASASIPNGTVPEATTATQGLVASPTTTDERGDDPDAADRAEIAEAMYEAAAERAEIAEVMYRAALTRGKIAGARERAAAERAAEVESLAQAAAERAAAAGALEQSAAERAATAEATERAVAERLAAAETRERAVAERTAAAEAMERAATERTAAVEAREKAAAERDSIANSRDRGAVERDSIANSRDRTALERDSIAGPRGAAGPDRVAKPDGAAEDVEDPELERARLEAQLQRAHLDALTGAFRREVGRLALRNEIERARRADGKFVIAFIDVDGLKGVNDQAGHAAGDRVLRTLAAIMRANLRAYDPIVRFGGDEFVCGISSIDPGEVQHRIGVMDQSLRNATGVGITAGLASLTSNETLEELTARADAALLEAKRSRDDEPTSWR